MVAIIILALFGVILLFAGIFDMRKMIMPIGVLGILLALAFTIQDIEGAMNVYTNMFLFDTYARAFIAICLVGTLLLFLLGAEFLKDDMHHKGDKYALMLFALCGAITMLSAQNLLMIFLGIEILSIPLYVLAGSQKDDMHSNEAGMKYFLMGAFATGILLFGMAMIYGATGQLELNLIWTNIIAHTYNHPMMNIGVLMILVAFCFKISAAPFHFWSPDVYDGTPSLFTAFMATVVKTAAFATFFKLFLSYFGDISNTWTIVLACISGLSMILANVTAIYQKSFKRMMAYSSISHAGYLLLAIISLNFKEGSSAILLYLSAYSIATIAAFTVFILVQQQTGRSDFEVFNGLGKRKPLLAVTMTIAMLSLAGIPLTAGFFGKYYLFSLSLHQYYPLVIIAILNSAISIYYYFRVIVSMWFKESEHHAISLEVSPIYNMIAIVTSLLIIAIGILPSLIIELFW